MTLTPARSLSPRELEVVVLLSRGFSVKEIASALELSTGTVKNYLASARRRTDSRTNVQLVVAIVPREHRRRPPRAVRHPTIGTIGPEAAESYRPKA